MSARLRVLGTLALTVSLLVACGHEDRAQDRTTGSDSAAPGPDPLSFTRYDADYELDAAGDLRAVETLTLDVPVDGRHGLDRTFDGGVGVQGFTATLDGADTPIAPTVADDGAQSFRIGDPDRTLSVGEHEVRIEYAVTDVLARSGPATFDWLLVPEAWSLRIDAADLSVELPRPVSDAVCTIGDGRTCEVTGLGSTSLHVEAEGLADHVPVHLTASLPPR